MMTGHLFAALLPVTMRSVRRWLFHLGGVGLIPLGLLDNSPIPVPGVMDIATLLLSARQQDLWLYYGLMATAGSVVGGFVTYRLARKGGKEALRHRFPTEKVEQVTKTFGRWGFGAIAIPALLPPPVPMTPFLFAAGAMQYPLKQFLAALTLGRAIRYLVLAYVAGLYGRQIISFIRLHSHPNILVIAVIIIVIGAGGLYFWRRTRSHEPAGR